MEQLCHFNFSALPNWVIGVNCNTKEFYSRGEILLRVDPTLGKLCLPNKKTGPGCPKLTT